MSQNTHMRRDDSRLPPIEVPAKTTVLFADIACPWAHAAVYRWRAAREHLGLTGEVQLDVRAFPLELINDQATPKPILDAEIPVVGTMEPAAGWQVWQGRPHDWPVTILPALEAVYAAKKQGLGSSADLDRALRLALFRDSRNISMHHEIMDVAKATRGVDADELEVLLVEGVFRSEIFDDLELAQGDGVQGSPHFFLPDGTDIHNPGVTMSFQGEHGSGFPVVSKDDPSIFEDLLKRAAT